MKIIQIMADMECINECTFLTVAEMYDFFLKQRG